MEVTYPNSDSACLRYSSGKYYLGASQDHILLNHGAVIFAEPCACFFQYGLEKSGFINHRVGDPATASFVDQSAHHEAGDYENILRSQLGFLKILFKISPGGVDEYLSSLVIGFFISVLLIRFRVRLNVLLDIPDVHISLGTYDIQRDSVSFAVLDNGHVDLSESLYIIICW